VIHRTLDRRRLRQAKRQEGLQSSNPNNLPDGVQPQSMKDAIVPMAVYGKNAFGTAVARPKIVK